MSTVYTFMGSRSRIGVKRFPSSFLKHRGKLPKILKIVINWKTLMPRALKFIPKYLL